MVSLQSLNQTLLSKMSFSLLQNLGLRLEAPEKQEKVLFHCQEASMNGGARMRFGIRNMET